MHTYINIYKVEFDKIALHDDSIAVNGRYLIFYFDCRCPLTSTLLLLIAAGAEPSTFPLIDSPPLDSVKASLTLLKELGNKYK